MSKINARSPFYLSYTTPAVPTPAFNCNTAYADSNNTGFKIDQEGVITEPILSFGSIKSFTSTDSGFSNGKYATVTSDTSRTVIFKINIPSDFSNSAAGTFDCPLTIAQPKKVTSGATPSCTGGPTKNGTISNVSIAAGGNTVEINLAAKFSAGSSAIAGFTLLNYHPSFVQMSVTGSTLTLTSLNVGGVKTVFVQAFDNGINTCTAVQSIQVTITGTDSLGCSDSSGVTGVGLVGGSITAAGVITKPDNITDVVQMRLTANGSAITSVSANTGSSAQNVRIFFVFTVPTGFSNTGATLVCDKLIVQRGTSLPTFTCDDAGFSDQAIYDTGSVNVGTAKKGTITGVTPVRFDSVETNTPRTINLSITIPAGFANAGTLKSGGCDIQGVLQPAAKADFGTVNYELATDFVGSDVSDFCQSGANLFRIFKVKSTATNITTAKNHTVASTDSNGVATRLFNGENYYYVVDTTPNRSRIDSNSGVFYIWKISENGVVTENYRWNCEGGEDGNGNEI